MTQEKKYRVTSTSRQGEKLFNGVYDTLEVARNNVLELIEESGLDETNIELFEIETSEHLCPCCKNLAPSKERKIRWQLDVVIDGYDSN